MIIFVFIGLVCASISSFGASPCKGFFCSSAVIGAEGKCAFLNKTLVSASAQGRVGHCQCAPHETVEATPLVRHVF